MFKSRMAIIAFAFFVAQGIAGLAFADTHSEEAAEGMGLEKKIYAVGNATDKPASVSCTANPMGVEIPPGEERKIGCQSTTVGEEYCTSFWLNNSPSVQPSCAYFPPPEVSAVVVPNESDSKIQEIKCIQKCPLP